jgi:hypothetical protein
VTTVHSCDNLDKFGKRLHISFFGALTDQKPCFVKETGRDVSMPGSQRGKNKIGEFCGILSCRSRREALPISFRSALQILLGMRKTHMKPLPTVIRGDAFEHIKDYYEW